MSGAQMSDVMDRVIAAKRSDLEIEKAHLPMRRAIELASAAPPPRDLVAALRRPERLNVIAEVRRAAADSAVDATGAMPAETARACVAGGAAAISVITDSRFMRGSPTDLEEVRAAVMVPLLRKDFIFDEYQIYTSRASGADAVLLIARVLETPLLRTLVGVARSLHMEALVEVRSEQDVERALASAAMIVGVNNRAAGAEPSIEPSLRLAGLIPDTVLRVSESGIETRADLDRLRAAGYHGFLIGERLARAGDPGAALAALVADEGA
jgi:indole-3-glycerol phosphate synthase